MSKVEIIYRDLPDGMTGEALADNLALLLTELIAYGVARVTDPAIDGGCHIANLVTEYHCSICHRAGDGDGRGMCRHKEALFTAEAAAESEAEAEAAFGEVEPSRTPLTDLGIALI